MYLQRHVGWHAGHLLEGALRSIIDIHNQQQLDQAEVFGLQLATTLCVEAIRQRSFVLSQVGQTF